MNRDEVIEIMAQVADLLYQGNTEYAYRMLRLILPELEKMMVGIGDTELQNDLKYKLMDALQAMEDKDHILLADILQYEIVEYVQRC